MIVVECIKGHPNLLYEGAYYTVVDITHKGNYILEEVEPPHPHTSFNKERFGEPQNLDFDLSELLEEELVESLEN